LDFKGVIYYELLKPGETTSEQQLIHLSDEIEHKKLINMKIMLEKHRTNLYT